MLYPSSAWFCPSTCFLQCLDSFFYSFASVLPCNSTFSYWMAWIPISLLLHLSKTYQSVLQYTVPLYQTEKQKTFCYKFLNSQPALVYIKAIHWGRYFWGEQAYQIAIFSYLMLKTCLNLLLNFPQVSYLFLLSCGMHQSHHLDRCHLARNHSLYICFLNALFCFYQLCYVIRSSSRSQGSESTILFFLKPYATISHAYQWPWTFTKYLEDRFQCVWIFFYGSFRHL